MYDAEEDLLYVGAEPNWLAVPNVSAVGIDVRKCCCGISVGDGYISAMMEIFMNLAGM